ncbi:hypothetical protein BN11_640002 [Nostocoides australiense Ben110]|uniref:Uncharacterized protein n=1 Tax=Nostocoides australiense Ben110 TaxID=1193182 RepID=W6K2G2_9MICO|nr:hypothetical protein BN11_640002 [Tetrasphaera australiensis Ben110]
MTNSRTAARSVSERETLLVFFASFGIELTLGSVSVITDLPRQPRWRVGPVTPLIGQSRTTP